MPWYRLRLWLRDNRSALWFVLAGWLAMAAFPSKLTVPALCGALPGNVAMGWRTLELAVLLSSPGALVLSWSWMLLAMMPLLLVDAVRSLWRRTRARRRWLALAVFLLAYGFVWMLGGLGLLALAVLMMVSLSPGLALGLGIAVAVVWQISPFKQHCLNRCHRPSALSAFGWPAVWSWGRYGATTGIWCLGSCWALMLLPMLTMEFHLMAMLGVSVWLWGERLLPPRQAEWRFSLSSAIK